MLSRDALRSTGWTRTYVVLKVDMRNASNMVSRQAVLDECATFFPSCYLGCHGAMGPILCCGTLLAGSAVCISPPEVGV